MSAADNTRLKYKNQGLTDAVLARRLHNDNAHIFQVLPAEILKTMISGLAHDAEKVWHEGVSNLLPGLALSHTCSRWREIAIITPDIWTYIPLTHAKWTRECLRRSQPLPVAVLCDPGDSGRAKAAALKQLDRLRMFTSEQEDEDDEGCPALRDPAPMLEYMRVMFAFPSERQLGALCEFFGGQKPPLLREVSITSAMLHAPIPFLRAQTIKSLNFSCCTIWNDLEAMADTLSCVPELEELLLEWSDIILNVPPSWVPPPLPTDNVPFAIEPIRLPRLKNLCIKVDFFQAALVLRHISLPQDIHTLSLHLRNCPNDEGYYKALFLPVLAPILREISEQPVSARKTTLAMSPHSMNILASKPLQPGVELSQYAGCFHVITNDRAGEGSFFCLDFECNPLTGDGCSILSAIAETTPSLFTVGSLTLKGTLDMALVLSERAWRTALQHMHVTEYLELEKGGAVGLVLQGTDTWISENRPSTLCLRNVTLDTITGFPNPEDFEEKQEQTFFDALRIRIRPWLQSKSLKRVLVRECPLQPWMVEELEHLLGKDGLDWDYVWPGVGVISGERESFDVTQQRWDQLQQ